MNVDIIEVRDDGQVLIRALGAVLLGMWLGDVPALLGRCFAELELPEVAWSAVKVAGCGTMGIVPGVVRGELVDYDYDGVGTLRCDGVDVLVEIEGEPPLGIVGKTIEFEVPSVEVYPYDV